MSMTKQHAGFSLAEILIALGLVAVLASFLIPKVLDAGDSGTHLNQVLRSAALEMQTAHTALTLNEELSGSHGLSELAAYFRHAKEDTTSLPNTEASNATATVTCSDSRVLCYQFESGAILFGSATSEMTFSEPTDYDLTDNTLWFVIDPDGGSGPERGVPFSVLGNGRVITANNRTASMRQYSPWTGLHAPPILPSTDIPAWFEWD